jgi:type IV secretion system protein VirB6
MVSGWRVFGLVPDKDERGGMVAAQSPAPTAVVPATTTAASSAPASDRRIPVSSFAVAPAANDAGSLGEGGRRETRVIARDIASGGAQVEPLMASGTSRARGIGSRFRAPPPRLSEKVK